MAIENLFVNKDQFDELIIQSRRAADALEDLAMESAADPGVLDSIMAATMTGENTTKVFNLWYPKAKALQGESVDKYALLERFAHMAASVWDKQYTLRSYDPDVSGITTMTPLDDLEGKTASPLCTDADTDSFHWMDEDPMYWYIRANALSLESGKMDITYFEGEPGFDISGEAAPVWTFKLSKYVRRWNDGQYDYISWRLSPAAGYEPYAGDVDFEDNSFRPITWLPTFPGVVNNSNALTSGASKRPWIRHSANQGITAARLMDAHEGLWTDCDTEISLDEWRFRHYDLENSNILEGCVNYNYQYTVAAAEEGVTRVLLTAAQAANIHEGSSVMVGAHGEGVSGNDRNTAGNYELADCVRVLSKTEVSIEGEPFVALNLDLEEPIDIPGTALVSTAPWYTGTTEDVPGHKDGSIGSLTNGHYPIRVGGVEYLHGAYDLGLDPLYQVTAGSDSSHFNYEVFTVQDSQKQSGSITANYKSTGIIVQNVASGWRYVKSFVENKLGVVFPGLFGGSASTYIKSSFGGAGSAGVRSPWRRGSLYNAGGAGLGCEAGDCYPSNVYWNGEPRLGGAGKKRGEWAA